MSARPPRAPRPSEIAERTRSDHRKAIRTALERVADAEWALAVVATDAVNRGVLSREEVCQLTGWSQATYYRRRTAQQRL